MFGSTRWTQHDDVFNFQREVDRLFNRFWSDLPTRTPVSASPSFQVHTTNDGWQVDVPFPGIDPKHVSDEFIAQTRDTYAKRGIDISGASDEDIRNIVALQVDNFEHAAPTSAARAATIILDGVRAGEWRILVGDDAQVLDHALRAHPTEAYTEAFTDTLTSGGHFAGLVREG